MIVAAPALVTGDLRTLSRLARPPSAERDELWAAQRQGSRSKCSPIAPDEGRHAEQAGGGDHGELLEYALVAADPGADAQ